MTSIKDMVKDGQKVKFLYYKSHELWYVTETGFEFPVPTYDTGDGMFLAEDKAMLFMRYIRKHVKFLNEAKKEAEEPVTSVETKPQCPYWFEPKHLKCDKEVGHESRCGDRHGNEPQIYGGGEDNNSGPGSS